LWSNNPVGKVVRLALVHPEKVLANEVTLLLLSNIPAGIAARLVQD